MDFKNKLRPSLFFFLNFNVFSNYASLLSLFESPSPIIIHYSIEDALRTNYSKDLISLMLSNENFEEHYCVPEVLKTLRLFPNENNYDESSFSMLENTLI